MGEGWEGVVLRAAQEASDSLRTASTKCRGSCSKKIEKLDPAEAGLAQYRTKRALAGDRSDKRARPSGGWGHPGAAGNDATPWF